MYNRIHILRSIFERTVFNITQKQSSNYWFSYFNKWQSLVHSRDDTKYLSQVFWNRYRCGTVDACSRYTNHMFHDWAGLVYDVEPSILIFHWSKRANVCINSPRLCWLVCVLEKRAIFSYIKLCRKIDIILSQSLMMAINRNFYHLKSGTYAVKDNGLWYDKWTYTISRRPAPQDARN